MFEVAPLMTPDQIRKQHIERFVALRQIVLNSSSSEEITECEEEMKMLKRELGLTTNQILDERARGLQELSVQVEINSSWGSSFNPTFANDIGAL